MSMSFWKYWDGTGDFSVKMDVLVQLKYGCKGLQVPQHLQKQQDLCFAQHVVIEWIPLSKGAARLSEHCGFVQL